MDNLYEQVKFAVEAQRCPTHLIAPVLNDDLKITCCCVDFKINCYKIMLDILHKHKAEPETTYS